jgi:transcriptional regulator with XRE-family HTH domain
VSEQPEPTKVGELVRTRRLALGLNMFRAAQRAGISHSSLLRIENGEIAQPGPSALTSLAAALDMPLADLFAAAGYVVPTELPSFKPYFRARYGELPDEVAAEVEWYAEQLARRHGITLQGPAPGEDETIQ